MSLATVNNARAVMVRAHVPAFGVWWCDVEIDEERTIAGAASIAIADLTLTGTVISGGPYQGGSRYRIAGGRGGWGKTIKQQGYFNDAGVKRSTVLKDAAQAAGETLDESTIAAGTLGAHFARESGPASLVLNTVSPAAWYVGEDGVTRIGRRARTTYTGQATRTAVDLAAARIDLASDAIAPLLPGAVVDGIEAVDVVHEVAGGKLRSTVWGALGATGNRRIDALRKVIAQLLPDYRYRGIWEYRVVTQEGERLNLQCATSRAKLPDLRRVRVRPGVAGCRADVALGSLVLVAFVNGDQARPVVVGFDDAESGGFAPSRLDLVGEDEIVTPLQAATIPGRALRYGDTVMMPTGPAATPAPVVLVPNPLAPSTVSRVRP